MSSSMKRNIKRYIMKMLILREKSLHFWLFLIGFEPIVVCLETCNALQFWPSQLNYMTLMNHIAAIAISNPAISSGFLLTGYNGANLYLKLHLE